MRSLGSVSVSRRCRSRRNSCWFFRDALRWRWVHQNEGEETEHTWVTGTNIWDASGWFRRKKKQYETIFVQIWWIRGPHSYRFGQHIRVSTFRFYGEPPRSSCLPGCLLGTPTGSDRSQEKLRFRHVPPLGFVILSPCVVLVKWDGMTWHGIKWLNWQ